MEHTTVKKSKILKHFKTAIKKDLTPKCKKCKEVFHSKIDRVCHQEESHGLSKSKKCQKCHRKFEKKSEFLEHDKKAHQTHQGMKVHMAGRMRRIEVPLQDQKVSQKIVKNYLEALKKCFGDGVFEKTFTPSGSYSTDTKIRKADEFDYDVPLKYSSEEIGINKEGKIFDYYNQSQKTPSLNVRVSVIRSNEYESIPCCYADVWVERDEEKETIYARKIQEQLYEYMQCAVKKLENVDLNRFAHGSAVTVTIKEPEQHHINVDISPSMKTKQITLTDYKWPRLQTKVLP